MKLYKALKLRKKLAGDIAKIKQQIISKNSYNVGSLNAEKYNIRELKKELNNKLIEFIELKCKINKANDFIQSFIYTLAERKGLVVLWEGINVTEGEQIVGYSEKIKVEYRVQIDEKERDLIVKELQNEIEVIQEEIDLYNYTTEI